MLAIAALPLEAGPWSFSGELATDVPIQVGGRLEVQGPWGLRATTSLGVLPGAYVDLINAVVVAAGGYDRQTADLVRSALRNSLIWRLHLGWRPWVDHGFYFEVGYALAALGGGLENEQLIAVATGVEPPVSDPAGNREYDVNSLLHLLDLEAGWRWTLWRGLTLRAAVGFAGTLGGDHEQVHMFFKRIYLADIASLWRQYKQSASRLGSGRTGRLRRGCWPHGYGQCRCRRWG